jgi:hypothetical protein
MVGTSSILMVGTWARLWRSAFFESKILSIMIYYSLLSQVCGGAATHHVTNLISAFRVKSLPNSTIPGFFQVICQS